MKRTPVTPQTLRDSVLAVPPLARTADYELDDVHNQRLIHHLEAGGVRTLMYGGNANVYNIASGQYGELFDRLPTWAADDTWIIPSIGPSYGQMLDHAKRLAGLGYPTAMALPLTVPATQDGTATGLRRAAEALGTPIIVYLKADTYLSPRHVSQLVDDGLVCGIKYAIVRDDPANDAYLEELVDLVDRNLIVSGIGERPAVVHFQQFGLRAFTSGSTCVAPRQSTKLLQLLQAEAYEEAEALRLRFLPLEDLRDGIHPIRVLHDAVTESGIANMGPMLPLLSNLSGDQRGLVGEAARRLAALEATTPSA